MEELTDNELKSPPVENQSLEININPLDTKNTQSPTNIEEGLNLTSYVPSNEAQSSLRSIKSLSSNPIQIAPGSPSELNKQENIQGSKSPSIQLPPKISTEIQSVKSSKLNSPKLLESELRSPKNISMKSEKLQNYQYESPKPLQSELKSSKSISMKSLQRENKSPKSMSIKSEKGDNSVKQMITNLEPRGDVLSEHVDALSNSIQKLSKDLKNPSPRGLGNNIDKIANMSKILTDEANALRESIKHLSADLIHTKKDLGIKSEEDRNALNFPYHLFLLEIILNKIHMKCECFDMDYRNIVISASFLGKEPIILYDSSCGKLESFSKLNIGKSSLFAMTYDTICGIEEFVIRLDITKQPPCTHCVTKIGESQMDYTKEFGALRKDLCQKWQDEQPKDNVLCTTSTSLLKNQFYLTCNDSEDHEPIGYVDCTVRMSFLGKEITTAFTTSSKPEGTSLLLKENNGITMYSCQKVEMDDQGKILLDEDSLKNKRLSRNISPISQISGFSRQLCNRKQGYLNQNHGYGNQERMPKYDEIFTKMNDNELKIRVPKSTKIERSGKYDRIEELCTCEDTPYNAGEQIQFELPRDLCNPDKTHDTYTSNLKYTYKGCDRVCESRDRKTINVTPTNCPVPINMEKVLHPQKDVFILKIGKKLETKDKKTDLEIELVTPKMPSEKAIEHTSQQCSSDKELKTNASKNSIKQKNKKSKKNKTGGSKKSKKAKK